jgi:hypothetical protein
MLFQQSQQQIGLIRHPCRRAFDPFRAMHSGFPAGRSASSDNNFFGHTTFCRRDKCCATFCKGKPHSLGCSYIRQAPCSKYLGEGYHQEALRLAVTQPNRALPKTCRGLP